MLMSTRTMTTIKNNLLDEWASGRGPGQAFFRKIWHRSEVCGSKTDVRRTESCTRVGVVAARSAYTGYFLHSFVRSSADVNNTTPRDHDAAAFLAGFTLPCPRASAIDEQVDVDPY